MALTLDSITVNTEVAENYLNKYNKFDAWPAPGKVWHVMKYPDDKDEYEIKALFHSRTRTSIGSYVARKLVEKIREHESTFYQLEYLIRKTDKADFENYFLLMCQHLQCHDGSWNLGNVNRINILMNEKTPLYVLGCVAAAKSSDIALSIITTQKMAPICHLFTNLCSQFRFNIILVFINDENIKDYFEVIDNNANNVREDIAGGLECTGVVTESADIDSALDHFIDSSVSAPWKIQQIYVQESVYSEVKEALAARCSRDVAQSCADAFASKKKTFVCDELSVKRGDGDSARVLLEAYRTTKELCVLLRGRTTPALSLWAADSQTAHEVALAAPARLVWINEYCTFHGPPASSLPVFERLYTFNYDVNSALRDLRKRWTYWNKLTKNERIDWVMNALQGLSSVPEDYDSIVDLQNDILNVRDESFVSVEDGKICFCVERAPIFENFICYEQATKLVLHYIITAVNGMAIVYGDFINLDIKIVLRSLEKAGVPVMYDHDSSLAKNVFINKLKVIRSNFGTIFAN